MKVSKKTFFLLWSLCIIGSLSIYPYAQSLELIPNIPMWKALVFGMIQTALFFGLICWLSFKILPKTDLHPFQFKSTLKQIIYPAVIVGLSLGFVLFFFDKTFFQHSLLSGRHPPFWTGALASIYGAVNEEVLLRLFLLTLIYFLLSKFVNRDKRLYVLWTANILAALIFGLGHLPAAFKLASPSPFEIFRILFLNGLAGVVFGWLYWSRGLWTAMAAHFATDLMIHVILI